MKFRRIKYDMWRVMNVQQAVSSTITSTNTEKTVVKDEDIKAKYLV